MGIYQGPSGIAGIPWDIIVARHPQFALAVLCDVPVILTARPIALKFASTAPNQALIPGAFASPMASYSIFAGADATIDPTNAFVPTEAAPAANPLKSSSDYFQAQVSGVACTVQVDSKETGQYQPISDPTPLELVPSMLNKGAGWWSLQNPQNVKVFGSIIASPPAAPFTAWLTFAFLTLQGGGGRFLSMTGAEARACLRKMGCGYEPAPGNIGAPPPPSPL